MCWLWKLSCSELSFVPLNCPIRRTKHKLLTQPSLSVKIIWGLFSVRSAVMIQLNTFVSSLHTMNDAWNGYACCISNFCFCKHERNINMGFTFRFCFLLFHVICVLYDFYALLSAKIETLSLFGSKWYM